ncbi:MAG: hypothetical protein HYU39_10920 [Thaumarchaeota archaeon]|nr:hypothetical protein [Nitrososphaerota archaeon]
MARYRRNDSPEYHDSIPRADAYGNRTSGYRIRIDETAPKHSTPTESTYEVQGRERISRLLEFLAVVDDPDKVDEILRESVETKSSYEQIESEFKTAEEIIAERDALDANVDPIEVSLQHEQLRRKAIEELLEEYRFELLDDFELTPENAPIIEDEMY